MTTPFCSPQRYLANNRNLVRTAVDLAPSSVLPVADSVLELPVARDGTGQVLLTGDYSGAEETTFDIEILDNTISVPLISVPVFTGAGSGVLSNIASTGTAQTYTLQLQNAGLPTLSAGIDFEGVRIIARAVGAAGNGIEIEIDQTPLVFTAQNFSLLEDLKAGDGGETSGLKGAAFDWDTKVISGNPEVIPLTAHRIAFGDDKSDIYLQYKKYIDGEWFYHFVPALRRDIPKGSRISFVTGGRDVLVTPLVGSPETFSAIVTVYDLLNALFTGSALVSIDGVIAFDRSPAGQAAKELAIRTDAHCERSTGTGSDAATGFVDTFANHNAATELVIATCKAVTSRDHPLARVGAERWGLVGSVSGDLGDIVTAIPFVDPDGKFGLTIPQVLPDNYGVPRGRFSYIPPPDYVSSDEAEQAPICPVALTLGTEAVDQTIDLVWTKRPSGDCLCADMPIPSIGGHCLGTFSTGDTDMGWQSDTVTRLVAFRDWAADTVAQLETLVNFSGAGIAVGFGDAIEPILNSPLSQSPWPPLNRPADLFQTIANSFENAITLIDPVTDTTLRTDGMDAWDDAVTELQADTTTLLAATPPLWSLRDDVYKARLGWALTSAGISPLGKSDASILESGDGCWRDMGGDFWTVIGSVNGAYAPCFNNVPFYACRLAADGHTYFSTKEFGFQLNIKCETLLKYGDHIRMVIGDAGIGGTYQIGDELVLPIIAAQPLTLAGGQDGNDNLDFYVSGSVDGPLPNFVYDPNVSPPGDYDSGPPFGLTFTYTPGGIPNQAGDKWMFDVEGGHWRYRRDGGAWVTPSPDDIDTVPTAFVDGLSIAFQTGSAPSFPVGDIYSFRVAQPWAVSNLQNPDRFMWAWDEPNPTLVVDLGSPQPISMAALARHTLPAGATVLLEGGTSPGVYPWSQPLVWTADAIAAEFPEQTARYLRLTLTGTTVVSPLVAGVGWLFAGTALTTTLSAYISPLRRVYKMDGGGSGLDQGGNYLGRAFSGTIKWTEASLTEADVVGLSEMLEWLKTHGDEAFVVIPNITRPAEAYAALIAVDDVAFEDISEYNRDVAFDRQFSIELPFAGVWRQ